jgi:hypothetical protein
MARVSACRREGLGRVGTAFLLIALVVRAGIRADAADPPDAGQPSPPAPSDFKLVVWYDRARPFDSFQYRVYNVTRGQYTKAVDDWMGLMDREFPRYSVAVRELRAVEADSAATVAAAVDDEKLTLAKSILQKYSIGDARRRSSYDSGYSGLWLSPAPSSIGNRSPFKNPAPRITPGLGSARMSPPPTYLFPTPWPYPRPHP